MSLIEFYESARPDEIVAGISWYDNAHMEAIKIAEYCKVAPHIGAAIIAVLSPRCNWQVNIEWAWRIAHSYINQVPILTGGMQPLQVNINKAVRILATRDVSILSGPKVLAFYDNILYPQSSREVTVDSWAYRAYIELIGITRIIPHNITEKRYTTCAQAYKEAAAQVDLLPCHFQAIVWIVCHRLEGK